MFNHINEPDMDLQAYIHICLGSAGRYVQAASLPPTFVIKQKNTTAYFQNSSFPLSPN